jgi:hypothetical protein
MDLLSMVMEARKKTNKRNDTGINITDEPDENEEVNDYTDTGEDEDIDATPDDYGNENAEGDVISDEAEDDQDTDYSEGDPFDTPENSSENPEAGSGDTPEQPDDVGTPQDNQPAEDAGAGQGGVTISDQAPDEAAPDQQNPDGGGTDYGEGMPEGEEDGNAPAPEGEGGEQPPAEGENPEGQPPEGGEEGAPPEEGGGEGEDPNAPPEGEGAEEQGPEGPNVDEPEKNGESRTIANNILLLRSYNRLHADIRKFARKVADAKHQSILGSVTYRQVVANLNELRDMVYKYILLSYDSSTYDENLANYYYFIEIMQWNLDMLEKVNEIVAKATEKKKDK